MPWCVSRSFIMSGGGRELADPLPAAGHREGGELHERCGDHVSGQVCPEMIGELSGRGCRDTG